MWEGPAAGQTIFDDSGHESLRGTRHCPPALGTVCRDDVLWGSRGAVPPGLDSTRDGTVCTVRGPGGRTEVPRTVEAQHARQASVPKSTIRMLFPEPPMKEEKKSRPHWLFT